jgi:hypothetical protein
MANLSWPNEANTPGGVTASSLESVSSHVGIQVGTARAQSPIGTSTPIASSSSDNLPVDLLTKSLPPAASSGKASTGSLNRVTSSPASLPTWRQESVRTFTG